ncbi:hypothetical protein N665_0049s0043 [Sinapis alba]|nr:hypothetical protein N665_0049s0043 [Sinapis alba]
MIFFGLGFGNICSSIGIGRLKSLKHITLEDLNVSLLGVLGCKRLPHLLTAAVVADPNFTALASDWEEPFPIKSIAYHTDDSKLFSAVRDALHDDEYEELKESRLGVFLKFKEMDFDPVRFSLIEFEQLTGLNCEYIEHLENSRCEVTNEMASFWERIGVSVDAGPSSEQIIRAYEGIYPWTNPKSHVVYVKEESFVKSLVVREEDIERPSKRARIEAPVEPRSEDIPDNPSGAIPDARSEAFIPVSGVDKAYIEKCFKDLTDVMRDGFGMSLKEMKLLGNRMDVVEKKLRITGKESSSHDLQQTTSSLPKRRLEHGSESVNGTKARQDEEPSSSKALSIEAKEKEVKEEKEKELKEKANKGLEKALAKAKEAKANEAKANEAKSNEAKAKEKKVKAKEKEAKAKEKEAKAKEKEEKETKEKEEKEAKEKEVKLAAEACLGKAKLEEEAKAKEAADKAKEPDESAAEASVVLMDKDEDTVSDVKMKDARRLAKKDSALAAIRGRSERDRKLAPSQQSPFQGNSTTKLIIPNTKNNDQEQRSRTSIRTITGSPTNQVGQQPVDLNAILASLAAVVQRLDQQDAANKATQERLETIAAACLPPAQADDQDPDTARRRLFQTTMRNQAVDQATNEELLPLQGTIKDMSSKIHQATSFAPEIDRVLEATQKTSFTKKITDIRVRHQDKLRVPSFRGDSDPSDHMTSFNIAMGRAYFSAEERDAGYCQLFVESLAGPVLTWFSRLAADSISTFKELSTEFLKHYSMYIRQGASATDLWKISQGQKESLHDFMERFKNLVSKVDVPDKTAVEALRNAL